MEGKVQQFELKEIEMYKKGNNLYFPIWIDKFLRALLAILRALRELFFLNE